MEQQKEVGSEVIPFMINNLSSNYVYKNNEQTKSCSNNLFLKKDMKERKERNENLTILYYIVFYLLKQI